MQSDIYQVTLNTFKKKYPKTFASVDVTSLLTPNLISPRVFELPKMVLTQAEIIFKTVHELAQTTAYQKLIPDLPFNPNTESLLTSFDFHWDGSFLKLIEINTNASSYLMGDLVYDTHQAPGFNQRLDSLYSDFKNCLQGGTKIFILDEQPEQENLYIEFFMYKEFLESKGLEASIISLAEFNALAPSDYPDLVYNRYCDFNLSETKSKILKKAYENNLFKLSPHPYFYELLANKNRFLILSDKYFISSLDPSVQTILQNHILHTQILNSENADSIWQTRKSIFIKPGSSYGGKAAYRGASISRKKFNEVVAGGNHIAQELAPVPEVILNTPDGDLSFKYDLRFYGFAGKVDFAQARFYRGQITNMREPHGGLTPIIFV